MEQLYPALRACAFSEVYSDITQPRSQGRVMMNVVTTADGRAALGGTSAGIGSETDHLLMRKLRSLSDAVLHGAGTLLHEGVDPGVPARYEALRLQAGMRAQPLTVLLGGREGVRLRGALSRLGPEGLVVFLPEHADPAPLLGKATIHTCPGARPDPKDVVGTLRSEHGCNRLLLEGGPTVYGAFLRAGLVDEIFWTLAPKLAGGGDAPGMFEATSQLRPPMSLRLLSIYKHESELYLRYAVEPQSSS